MASTSQVGTKGRVYIPNAVMQRLRLKEGDYITWQFDRAKGHFYIRRKAVTTTSEFERMELKNTTRTSVLSILKEKPKTFTELKRQLKVSSKTLSLHLKECEKVGLVTHERRNAPYGLTERGRDMLDIAEGGPVEGNDVVVQVVEKGSYLGSLVIRFPRRLAKQFHENGLYSPRTIEHLHQIMQLSLEYWVNKHQRDPHVTIIEWSKDFNRNGVPDLVIYDMPHGYPNIKKAIKDDKLGLLTIRLYDALEEKLKETKL